jgi:hypothetical protein
MAANMFVSICHSQQGKGASNLKENPSKESRFSMLCSTHVSVMPTNPFKLMVGSNPCVLEWSAKPIATPLHPKRQISENEQGGEGDSVESRLTSPFATLRRESKHGYERFHGGERERQFGDWFTDINHHIA